MSIDRYELTVKSTRDNWGDWVMFDDHQNEVSELEEKIEKLEAKIESLKELLKGDAE